MSIGSQKSRPSSSQGPHPLVSSRSAPVLRSASASEVQRLERPPRELPSPDSPVRRVEQLHPAVSTADATPQTLPEGKGDHKHAPLPQVHGGGTAGMSLVRFVGAFMLPPHAPFEEENDALTALTESVQASVQQQPDTAGLSSGEVTPLTRPATPQGPGNGDSSGRPASSR